MRVHRSSEPQGAATARARREKTASVSAPLFKSLIEPLAEDRRWVVLDLGPARQETLALLSGYRCRVDIADLTQDIDRVSAAPCDGDPEASRVRLPDIRNPEPADIVFCWDVLNYLDGPRLAALMAQIATRCRAGALVHALIVYSERLMHACAAQFVPADAGTLVDLARTPPDRAAPRYSTESLSQAMPDYSVDRVRLLSNGMQEYLFRTRSLRDALGDPAELAPGRPTAAHAPRKQAPGRRP